MTETLEDRISAIDQEAGRYEQYKTMIRLIDTLRDNMVTQKSEYYNLDDAREVSRVQDQICALDLIKFVLETHGYN